MRDLLGRAPVGVLGIAAPDPRLVEVGSVGRGPPRRPVEDVEALHSPVDQLRWRSVGVERRSEHHRVGTADDALLQVGETIERHPAESGAVAAPEAPADVPVGWDERACAAGGEHGSPSDQHGDDQGHASGTSRQWSALQIPDPPRLVTTLDPQGGDRERDHHRHRPHPPSTGRHPVHDGELEVEPEGRHDHRQGGAPGGAPGEEGSCDPHQQGEDGHHTRLGEHRRDPEADQVEGLPHLAGQGPGSVEGGYESPQQGAGDRDPQQEHEPGHDEHRDRDLLVADDLTQEPPHDTTEEGRGDHDELTGGRLGPRVEETPQTQQHQDESGYAG